MAHAVGFLEKDKSIFLEVRKRFTYLTVDEYQDAESFSEIDLILKSKLLLATSFRSHDRQPDGTAVPHIGPPVSEQV